MFLNKDIFTWEVKLPLGLLDIQFFFAEKSSKIELCLKQEKKCQCMKKK